MSFLDKIRACNVWQPADYVPFELNAERVGSVRRADLDLLRAGPLPLDVRDERVRWIDAPEDFGGRTSALAELVQWLVGQGAVSYTHGELYPVTASGRDAARCLVDRAAAPFFGMRAFGQHMNGFVRTASGIEMWIGRRSADRRLYPRHLDNLVAGGLPFGLGLRENLRKECAEEAGIPAGLADRAVAVGAITYCRASDRGLKPDVMYCYDLELPDDFEPCCTDGEVEAFYRMSVERVLEIVRDTAEFKLNCNLVIIDFLIRNGLIPQDDTEYLDILRALRSPLP